MRIKYWPLRAVSFTLLPATLGALGALTTATIATPAQAQQDYPNKPVRYIVPFPAGASPDLIGRLLSDRMGRLWGQQLVVDNRAGAGGTLGASIAAHTAPDGYTLFQCNIASSAIAPSLYTKLAYDVVRDFAPITRIGTTANLIIVNPSFPAATVAELVAQARATPGKLSYGSSGAGSSPHLAMELFKTMNKIDIVHIIYKGSPQALADLVGGQVPISISTLPAYMSPVKSGRVRALAVTSLKRAPQLPNVPTMDESGQKGYDVTSWFGVCAPGGVPLPLLNRLHADFTKVLTSPDVQQRLMEMVVEPAPDSREDFAAFIASETKRWAQVARDAKVPVQ